MALPYDSRANDFTIGTEWTNARNMLRVAYSGSWFDNLAPTLVWDSPLDLNDGVENPGRGRMSLWPSNSAQTISFGGYTKLARRTQVTGSFSYGLWSNDEPLEPFTINAALPQFALPRATTEGEAHVFSTNLSLNSRPSTDWRFSARVRNYTYDNLMPATSITDMVSYDSSASTTPTGGPDLYAHSRTTFDGDATWTKLMPFALTVGYSHNGNGYDARIFESSGENVFRVSADAVGTSWLTFRTQYEVGDRTGSDLDETRLTAIGEQPKMRHYDVADRTRNRFTAQADIVPSDAWTFSVATGVLKDDFSNSFYGLQDSTGRTFSLAADFQRPNGFGAGGSYNYERYAGLQRSHEGDSSTAQFNDPLRDWTADSTETVNYFSIYASPPRIGANTEIRVAYDFSYAEGSYLYADPGGQPDPAAQSAARRVQQAAAAAHRRAVPALRPPRRVVLVPVRAAEHLRLRVRPERGQRHRAAELAGHGLRVSALHRPLGGVRHSVSLVVVAGTSPVRHMEDLYAQDARDQGMARCLRSRLFRRHRECPGRRAGEEGAGGVRRAEMFDLPLHRGCW